MAIHRRLARVCTLLGTCLVFVALPARAQRNSFRPASSDTGTAPGVITGLLIDQLPVDSVIGALLLTPGVGVAADDGVSVRGSAGGATSVYLDGIPVTSGSRHPGLVPGTNALAEAVVLDGPLSAALGNGGAGAIVLRSRTDAAPRLSFETDGPLGATRLGLNRAEASVGLHLSRRVSLLGAGVLEGQKSAEPGFGARAAPIFVRTGVDTTVTAGATPVDVYNFAVSRGDCDPFSASSNAGIASNYGLPCHGDRTPLAAQSSQQVLLKAGYGGDRLSIGAMALRTRSQGRAFNYLTSFLPSNAFGRSTTSDLLALTLAGRLGRTGIFRASLSSQSERLLDGPLSADGELASRDPALGFLIGQLGFAYDFASFPVDSTLVDNYRNNISGSRRSPYDLENTSQYQIRSPYLSDPYGLGGFAESGGPVGTLTLYRERRIVGTADAQWQVSPNSRFRLGGELTHYSVDSYSHQLTSSALSDVWIEKPLTLALYAEDTFQYGPVSFSAGVRYDRFDSHGARPYVLDTVAASSTFDTYQPLPRITSYSGTFQGQPLAMFVGDKAHGAFSPRLRLAYALSRGSQFRIGYARQAQVPDFATLYAGINTDIAISNGNQVFATDLDLEKSSIVEIGLRQSAGAHTSVDLSLYERRLLSGAVGTITDGLTDPTRGTLRASLRQFVSTGTAQARGLDVRVERRQGGIAGFIGYAYQHVTEPVMGLTGGLTIATADERPHTFSGGLSAAAGGSAAFASFRLASGQSYYSCASGDPALLTPDICPTGGLPGARLPALKLLDLRLTQTLHLGAHAITAYVDARNLLDTRNVQQVFTATGTTTSPLDQSMAFSMDSSRFAQEATANAIYQSDGSVNLTTVAQSHAACAAFVTFAGQPGAADCISLIRAEQRWGNGDGIFTVAEQHSASSALYATRRGEQALTGAPRRVRVGLQVGF